MLATVSRPKVTKIQEYRLRQMRKSRIRDYQARELMLYRADGQPVLLPVNPGRPQKP